MTLALVMANTVPMAPLTKPYSVFMFLRNITRASTARLKLAPVQQSCLQALNAAELSHQCDANE